MEPVRKEQGSAGDEHAGHRNAEAVGVMQREWVVHTLLAFAQADGAAARRIPGTPSMEIFIAEDAAFGPPRRPGSVEQRGFGRSVGCSSPRTRRLWQPLGKILQGHDR